VSEAPESAGGGTALPPADEWVGRTSSAYTGGAVSIGERVILDVEVTPELCMNFLNCMRIATGAFARDHQTGRTRPARWQQVEPAKLWKAGWSCPSGAIRFVTDRGYVVPRWEEAAQWRTEAHPAAGRRRAPAEQPR
jgi:uncharacterized Fe-S cluster protein YjdI